jgi:hypothetical protein
MTSSRLCISALASLVTAAALVAGPAVAQPRTPSAQELETARSLYKEGKGLRAAGNLGAALEKFQAAHALGNTPVTGIELARTYVMVGRLVEAREVCLQIARMPVASDETEKSAGARTEAAALGEELRPRIPSLSVRIEGAAAGEGVHLSIDGAEVPDVASGEPQKVNPGVHRVAARVGEGAEAREARGDAAVQEGQAAEMILTIPPAAALAQPTAHPRWSHPRKPQAPAAPPPGALAVLVPVGFAAAVVGGAVGVLGGVSAWNRKSRLPDECLGTQCDSSNGGAADLNAARTWATVSTVGFAVAGAGAVAGVVGLLLGPRESHAAAEARVSPWIGATMAGIRARF